MRQIDLAIDAATEGVRASHPWSAKAAARLLRMHENGVGRWWQTVEERLIQLYQEDPGATTGAIALLLARAESERRRNTQARQGKGCQGEVVMG